MAGWEATAPRTVGTLEIPERDQRGPPTLLPSVWSRGKLGPARFSHGRWTPDQVLRKPHVASKCVVHEFQAWPSTSSDAANELQSVFPCVWSTSPLATPWNSTTAMQPAVSEFHRRIQLECSPSVEEMSHAGEKVRIVEKRVPAIRLGHLAVRSGNTLGNHS